MSQVEDRNGLASRDVDAHVTRRQQPAGDAVVSIQTISPRARRLDDQSPIRDRSVELSFTFNSSGPLSTAHLRSDAPNGRMVLGAAVSIGAPHRRVPLRRRQRDPNHPRVSARLVNVATTCCGVNNGRQNCRALGETRLTELLRDEAGS